MGNLFSQKQPDCIFCTIIAELEKEGHEEAENSKILCHNDDLALFSDYKPASKHHYLVVPRKHIGNPKTLNSEDHVQLIKDMVKFGKEYLEANENVELTKDVRFGFHWPPVISVEHLHLHVICPSSNLSYFHSVLFRENSWYFVSPEYLINRLLNQSD